MDSLLFLPSPNDTRRDQDAAIRQAVAESSARVYWVASISGGRVTLTDALGGTLDEPYARLAGFALTVGDPVLAVEVVGKDGGRSLAVLGKLLGDSLPASLTFDANPIGKVIAGTPYANDAAVSPSTAATVTYQTAASTTLVLPAGTWTVRAEGALQAIRSAAGIINVRMNIDGTPGTAQNPAMDATVYTAAWAVQELTGVAGGRTITLLLEYKNNSAATATARQVKISAITATRTA